MDEVEGDRSGNRKVEARPRSPLGSGEPGDSRWWYLAQRGFRPTVARWVVVMLAVAAVAYGWKSGSSEIVVTFAFSSDAQGLLAQPIAQFNNLGYTVEGRPIRIEPNSVSSGTAEGLIESGTLQPVAWMPASSIWAKLLNLHTGENIAPQTPKLSIVQSPQVIAVWTPVADELLKHFKRAIGWKDLFQFAKSSGDWTKAAGETGSFRLAQPSPESSTSGLSGAISEYYAAVSKTSDLASPRDTDLGEKLVRQLEQAIAHSGPTATIC